MVTAQLNVCAFECQNLLVYLHQFSAVVQIKHQIWCYFEQNYIKFGANSAAKFYKYMQELHLLLELFGTKLVSNISTKALKIAPYLKPFALL